MRNGNQGRAKHRLYEAPSPNYPGSPPLDEQAAIVRFLDHADEQIQRYIASKERLIALLEEERQALVHQAVTRGLDPNVKLKDSGVEWLGDVPEHWEVTSPGELWPARVIAMDWDNLGFRKRSAAFG